MRIKTILILISVVLIYSCGSNTPPEKSNKTLYGLNYNHVREKLGLELLTNDFECDCLDPENYLVWVINIDNQVINKIIFGLEHKIYSLLYDNKIIIDSIDYMNTLNRFEWNYLLHKNKFKTMTKT